ncbi:MAG TPA: hypothetical protein VKS44_02415, partial [Candidatus Acidoferrales bacterium]|nr:hypothetical protein [Candidatus Acidoferrales bacterium]
GFYDRTAILYHHLRGTPPKQLVWVPVSRTRWRIDWPRTNRGAASRQSVRLPEKEAGELR